MTNQQHPITPPPELRQLWAQQAQRIDPYDPVAWQEHVATQAAQWGSDQELEECCAWLDEHLAYENNVTNNLRAARRPKLLSLKEQALKILDEEPEPDDMKELIVFDTAQVEIIRRALEQLDD